MHTIGWCRWLHLHIKERLGPGAERRGQGQSYEALMVQCRSFRQQNSTLQTWLLVKQFTDLLVLTSTIQRMGAVHWQWHTELMLRVLHWCQERGFDPRVGGQDFAHAECVRLHMVSIWALEVDLHSAMSCGMYKHSSDLHRCRDD